jgi:hypothetical protein
MPKTLRNGLVSSVVVAPINVNLARSILTERPCRLDEHRQLRARLLLADKLGEPLRA